MKKVLKKAFTLVELLVVIAILAILATVSVVGYSTFTKKANISNDATLITQINNALVAEESLGHVPSTMHEARQLLLDGEYGIDIGATKLATKGYHLGYDIKENKVVLLKSLTGTDLVEAPDNYTLSPEDALNVFVVKSDKFGNDDTSCLFSEYAADGVTVDQITTNRGFDAGNADVGTVTFKNETTNARNVSIRTNSASTKLVINDKSDYGKIKHYGKAGELSIIDCAPASYNEKGEIAYADITTGRLIIENGAKINTLNLTATNNSYDNIILAKKPGAEDPEKITRDAVTISSGDVLIVTIQELDTSEGTISETEEVYAYASGSTGFANKDAEKNTKVDSSLGTKILEETAGKNAVTEAQKTEIKNEAINEALEVERLEDFKENNYWIGCAADKFDGGTGTESDPYQIATAEQLARLAYLMSTNKYGQYNTKSYILKNNIDLSGKCWIPIFTTTRDLVGSRYFNGTFDGNNKTISGINAVGLSMNYMNTMINSTTPINSSGEFVYGLFGDVGNATIKNLTMSEVNIVVGTGELDSDGERYLADSVGSVVGYVASGCTLTMSNVHIESGSLLGYESTGGLIGRVYGSVKMSDCSNKANVSSIRRASGLIGYANKYTSGSHDTTGTDEYHFITGNGTLYFENCSNYGTITCLGAYYDYAETSFINRHVASAYVNLQPDGTTLFDNPNDTLSNSGTVKTYFANGTDYYDNIVYICGTNSGFAN